jgi:hypothetical protein
MEVSFFGDSLKRALGQHGCAPYVAFSIAAKDSF